MKINQKIRILNYIREFGSISSYEAFKDLGVSRLASRIHDLKKDGYIFQEEQVCAKNRWGETCYFKRYSLVS